MSGVRGGRGDVGGRLILPGRRRHALLMVRRDDNWRATCCPRSIARSTAHTTDPIVGLIPLMDLRISRAGAAPIERGSHGLRRRVIARVNLTRHSGHDLPIAFGPPPKELASGLRPVRLPVRP